MQIMQAEGDITEAFNHTGLFNPAVAHCQHVSSLL